MEEKSAFQKLKDMKKSAKTFYYHKNYQRSSKNKERRLEPLGEDLSNGIREEMLIRSGGITVEDRTLALNYLAEDFQRARNNASFYYQMLRLSNPDSVQYTSNMAKTQKLLSRASNDLLVIRCIEPFEEKPVLKTSYNDLISSLRNMRYDLYIAWEFPENFKKISPLYRKLKNAAKREDYGQAARIRDEIKRIRPLK